MTTDLPPVTGEQLYGLLPAALRRRDAESGNAVRALFDIIAEQIAVVDADIEQLGENWFIETCAEWAIPYLGDLLGVRGVHQVGGAVSTTGRAWVANTLRFRSRKGTTAMLEQLARDTTGWPAKAVEFFEQLSATQHMNHLRRDRTASADLRHADALELVGGPFDSLPRTVDVRNLRGEQGWFNIPNIGLFVWPIGSAWLEGATPRPAADPDDGRYFVDPLGADRPLFVRPAGEGDIEQFAQEENVPGLLRRRPLYYELEERRSAAAEGRAPQERFFSDHAMFRIHVAQTGEAQLAEVPAVQLHVCDLTTWRRPGEAGHVFVDPVLGRIAFPDTQPPHRVRIDHAYGAGGDIGAGSYSRRDTMDLVLDRPVDWQAGVRAPEPEQTADEHIFPTLASAVAAWNDWQKSKRGKFGIITVMDSHRYAEPLTGDAGIQVGAGNKLAVIAAQWPGGPPGAPEHRPGRIEPVGLRPCVAGPIDISGADDQFPKLGEVVLDGLLIDGELRVRESTDLGRLTVRNSSLVPSRGGIQVDAGNAELTLEIHRSFTGPTRLPPTVRQLNITGTVIQAPGGGRALDTPATDLTISDSTVLGETVARKLFAENTLFTSTVTVERSQSGCVRFSYVPPGPPESRTPRRYRCLPQSTMNDSPLAGPQEERSRLVPRFLSTEFGHFGYAFLAPDAASELLTGAEHGGEIGAFGLAQRPQRLANLMSALDEYLPFGLDAAPLPVIPRRNQ
ncbi:hypothetical protein [Streptomyces sp. NPDC001657]|uniref:hypothetical protein n=1 Tax=Streptomyces sp. NPDC001657 TaxID=3154522 RepID=UPI00331F5983